MATALLLLTFLAGIPQDQPKDTKPPKRGDVVVAKGCLRGGVLESAEASKPGADSAALVSPFNFRLTGDKKILQEIKKDHDGHADVLTGELRTDLPAETPGKKIGNSRISIGVGASRGMMPEPPAPLPVLKVTSFEHTGVICR